MRSAIPARTSLSALSSASGSGTSLNFRLSKELLQHKSFYNDSLRPFLNSLSPHSHGVLRYLPTNLLSHARDESTKKFLSLEEVLRKPVEKKNLVSTPHPFASTSAFTGDLTFSTTSTATTTKENGRTTSNVNPTTSNKPADPSLILGMEALNTFSLIKDRLEMTEHKSLTDVPYEFNVGDLVIHRDLRQLGVVAARLPVCLESEKWVVDNLGSMNDKRMSHPWYLILVAHHAGLPLDFVRYGSQLTHMKMTDAACKPIGFHRLLPLYFQGYNYEEGKYIPRGKLPKKDKKLTEEEIVELTNEAAAKMATQGAASIFTSRRASAANKPQSSGPSSGTPPSPVSTGPTTADAAKL